MRCFNTASGMDCMQLGRSPLAARTILVSIPQAVWIACNKTIPMQVLKSSSVSIPQAVWIACNEKCECITSCQRRFNTASGMDCMQSYGPRCPIRTGEFQYRKRYGLHAILSPGSLGNSEPRSRFSDTDPLFAFFPKVRGTFLSRKVLRKGLEASHSKGTFVHERNLILMAFSLDFRASLEQSIS